MHDYLPFFQELKREIHATYRLHDPDCPGDFRGWKLRCIKGFQQDLIDKVNGQISTKWFYTHLKNDSTKAPRIDVLNLLSQYCGYRDWEHFMDEKRAKGFAPHPAPSSPPRTRGRLFRILAVMIVAVVSLGFYLVWAGGKAEPRVWHICLVDADLGAPITTGAEIVVLSDRESPAILKCDSNGCCQIRLTERKVVVVVKADYYAPDTIRRTLAPGRHQETVRLKSDDYALMISIFSKSDVENYERRRAQLEEMFTDDARIFQLYPGHEIGMEMYNKEEFINKLTMPLKSLKNIAVLETEYRNGRIYSLRFIQK
jgi:hypothetical protein